MRFLAFSLVVLAFSAVGCVDTSPDRVKLVASFENVALSVQKSSLVTTLAGTYDVLLEVGDLASGDETLADPPSFQLVTAKDRATLLVLDAVPTGDGFPVVLKSGEQRTLSFTLTDKNTLAAAEATTVCAGQLVVVGSVRGTLNGGKPTTFESAAFTLGGCP